MKIFKRLLELNVCSSCEAAAKVPVISRFMQEEGPRIQHSAVLGPRPSDLSAKEGDCGNDVVSHSESDFLLLEIRTTDGPGPDDRE